MLRLTLLAAALMLSVSMQAQRSINRFIDRQAEYQNVTTVELSGFLLRSVAKFADDESGKRILASIRKLQLLVVEDGRQVSAAASTQLRRQLERQEGFEPLIYVRSEGTQVHFMVKEEDNIIQNVLMLVHSPDELILIHLRGRLRIEDLRKLDFDLKGGDQFKNLPVDFANEPRA